MHKKVLHFFTKFAILAAAFCGAACTAEQIKDLAGKISGNEDNLSGSYALSDINSLCNTYISFSKGKMFEYSLPKEDSVVVADNYLWNVSPGDFSLVNVGEYVVASDILYCDGVPYGAVSFDGDRMILDEKPYLKFSGMKKERYATIVLDEGFSNALPPQKADILVPISVNRSLPSVSISASTNSDWLHLGVWSDGMFPIKVDANDSGGERSGKIVFSYPGSLDFELTFTQGYSIPIISLTPNSQVVEWDGGTFSFELAIENPFPESTATVHSSSEWISDIQLSGNMVSYKIDENLTGDRIGRIVVSYPKAVNKSFEIRQSGLATNFAKTYSFITGEHTNEQNQRIVSRRFISTNTDYSFVSWIQDELADENAEAVVVVRRYDFQIGVCTMALDGHHLLLTFESGQTLGNLKFNDGKIFFLPESLTAIDVQIESEVDKNDEYKFLLNGDWRIENMVSQCRSATYNKDGCDFNSVIEWLRNMGIELEEGIPSDSILKKVIITDRVIALAFENESLYVSWCEMSNNSAFAIKNLVDNYWERYINGICSFGFSANLCIFSVNGTITDKNDNIPITFIFVLSK